MARKATSIHLTVTPKGDWKSVFQKTFFEAKAYNAYINSDEFKEQFPPELFAVIKEVY